MVEEAKEIYTNYREHLYKISAIGYKELFDHFDGIISLEEAIEEIKQESRRYAKRQLTWFKNKDTFEWFLPNQKDQILEFITNQISK